MHLHHLWLNSLMTIWIFYRNTVPIIRYSRYVFNMNSPHILMFCQFVQYVCYDENRVSYVPEVSSPTGWVLWRASVIQFLGSLISERWSRALGRNILSVHLSSWQWLIGGSMKLNTLIEVFSRNPLHVPSCEVVAWLAHHWWRLSCLSQRLSM